MILAWMWVGEYRCLKQQSFSFCSDYDISYDRYKNRLNIKKTSMSTSIIYKQGDRSDWLSALSVIVGPNGTGKSSVAALLFSDPKQTGIDSDVVCVFADPDSPDHLCVFSTLNIDFERENDDGINIEYCKLENISQLRSHNVFGYGSSLLVYDTNAYLGHSLKDNCFQVNPKAVDISLAEEARDRSSYKKRIMLDQLVFLSHCDKTDFEKYIPFKLPRSLRMIWKTDEVIPKFEKLDNRGKFVLEKLETLIGSKTKWVLRERKTINKLKKVIQYEACKLAFLNVLSKNNSNDIQALSEFLHRRIKFQPQDLFKEAKKYLEADELEAVNKLLECANEIETKKAGSLVDKLYKDDELTHNKKASVRPWEGSDDILSEQEATWDWIIDTEQQATKALFAFIKEYCERSIQRPFLQFEWKMSSGEECLFSTFARYYNLRLRLKEKLAKKASKEYSNMLLFIDEADIYMHPVWQQRYLQVLLAFLKKYFGQEGLNYKVKHFQLIITTHSPIMLSDIAEKDVIFLRSDGGNNGGKKHRATFCANIHSLFYDSFALEKGSMGLIAKDWVQKLINACWSENQEVAKQKERYNTPLAVEDVSIQDLKFVASLIGEPVIRERILEALQLRENKN